MRIADIAILWDMDGTIFDTRECHFLSWQETLHNHGYSLEKATFETNFGRNTSTILPIFLGFKPDEEQAKLLIDEKERNFRQDVLQQATLVPGVREWLRRASGLHIPQAVASSGSKENIGLLISGFNLSSFFSALISGADQPAKPEPDVFLKAARSLNRQPENCLVIEDSLSGVKAAKNAGMRCIAVTTSQPRSALHDADLIVADFSYPFDEMLEQLDIT
jgi:beta-phosphoglucomutase